MKTINQKTASGVASGTGWDDAGGYDSSEHSWPCSGRFLTKLLHPSTSTGLTHTLVCFPQQSFFSESGSPPLQSTNYLKSIFIWAPNNEMKYNYCGFGRTPHKQKLLWFWAQLENQFWPIAWCTKSAGGAFHDFPQLFHFAIKLLMHFSCDKWSSKSHNILPLVRDLVGTRDWERMNCYGLQ